VWSTTLLNQEWDAHDEEIEFDAYCVRAFEAEKEYQDGKCREDPYLHNEGKKCYHWTCPTPEKPIDVKPTRDWCPVQSDCDDFNTRRVYEDQFHQDTANWLELKDEKFYCVQSPTYFGATGNYEEAGLNPLHQHLEEHKWFHKDEKSVCKESQVPEDCNSPCMLMRNKTESDCGPIECYDPDYETNGNTQGCEPTLAPTNTPTKKPTAKPSFAPTTLAPTKKPTLVPTKKPTLAPTKKPTFAPTNEPTSAPTESPTFVPWYVCLYWKIMLVKMMLFG